MKINCNWVPVPRGKDKICHMIAGAIIAIVSTIIFGPGWGVSIGAAAGVLKELYDYKANKEFNFFDMFATILGAVLGMFATMATYMIFIV